MFGAQIGQALGALARRGASARTDVGLPLGPAGTAALLPANIAAFGDGPRRAGRRGAALPRAARGRPPAAVRPRAVAARAPVRRGRGLRPRHHGRHRAARGGRSRSVDPSNPEALQEALQSGHVRARGHPGAEGRAGPAGDRCSRWSRAGSTRSSTAAATGACPAPTRCARRSAAAAPPAVRPSRPSPRWSGWSCGRAGCARPPRCGRELAERPRHRRAATRCGRTPTCCPTADDLDDPAGFVAARRAARPVRPRRPAGAAGRRRRRVSRPTRDPARRPRVRDADRVARRRPPSRTRCGGVRRLPRRRTPTALWRTCAPGHLTASALVLDPGRRQVLLTLHPKVGRWLQLGGHCEPGDDARRRALREATEECGIDGLARRRRPAAAGPARRALRRPTASSAPPGRAVPGAVTHRRRRAAGQRRSRVDVRVVRPVDALPAGSDAVGAGAGGGRRGRRRRRLSRSVSVVDRTMSATGVAAGRRTRRGSPGRARCRG